MLACLLCRALELSSDFNAADSGVYVCMWMRELASAEDETALATIFDKAFIDGTLKMQPDLAAPYRLLLRRELHAIDINMVDSSWSDPTRARTKGIAAGRYDIAEGDQMDESPRWGTVKV